MAINFLAPLSYHCDHQPADIVFVIPVCPNCSHNYDLTYLSELKRSCVDEKIHSQQHSGPTKWPLLVQDSLGNVNIVRSLPKDSESIREFCLCRHWPDCRYKNTCNFAHSQLELDAWNWIKKEKQQWTLPTPTSSDVNPLSPTSITLPPPYYDHPVESKQVKYSRSGSAGVSKQVLEPLYTSEEIKHKKNFSLLQLSELKTYDELLTSELKYENYKDKFHILLYYEEHEHARILSERCDGIYEVLLFHDKRSIATGRNEAYGIILGISTDNLMYIEQAAIAVKIPISTHTVIEPKIEKFLPHPRTENALQIQLSPDHVKKVQSNCPELLEKKTKKKLKVEFVLKHKYFANLHKSLSKLSLAVLKKLVPKQDAGDDKYILDKTPLQRPPAKCFDLDEEYQEPTLKKLLSCKNSVPFLITGPFGTGKTRLLASAFYYILKDPSARVLLCTCHMQSADAYIYNYIAPLLKASCSEVENIKPFRIVLDERKYHNFDLRYRKYLKGLYDGPVSANCDDVKQSRLLVTTFLTALHLLDIVKPFTHILIDEGAQCREPEAVAPLCLADGNSKIVVTGDQLQVGPQMLVLGEKALKHGLATSLLERLHELCKTTGRKNLYHAALLQNYRCHFSIVKLTSELFEYPKNLKSLSRSQLHPLSKSGLEFVMTSLNSKVEPNNEDAKLYYDEAITTLAQVKKYINPWPTEWGPKDHSKICVTSPSRPQIKLLRQLLRSSEYKQISNISTFTTYELQGAPVVEHSNTTDHYICANLNTTDISCANDTVQTVNLYSNTIGGFPIPSVTWYHDGNEITNKIDTLVLNKNACDLLGIYQCIVSNEVGTRVGQILLTSQHFLLKAEYYTLIGNFQYILVD